MPSPQREGLRIAGDVRFWSTSSHAKAPKCEHWGRSVKFYCLSIPPRPFPQSNKERRRSPLHPPLFPLKLNLSPSAFPVTVIPGSQTAQTQCYVLVNSSARLPKQVLPAIKIPGHEEQVQRLVPRVGLPARGMRKATAAQDKQYVILTSASRGFGFFVSHLYACVLSPYHGPNLSASPCLVLSFPMLEAH